MLGDAQFLPWTLSMPSKKTVESSMAMALDSLPLIFGILQYMIITLICLIVDWLVHYLNGQTLLQIHDVYLAYLIVKLWRYRQPKNYRMTASNMALAAQKLGIMSQKLTTNYCKICQISKPSRFYHCRKCKECVYRMDHHCEWIDNCIAQFNFKVYLHLLLQTFAHSLATLLIILSKYEELLDISQYAIYYLVILVPVIYSTWESYRLIKDFWLCIRNNQTLIESFKRVVGKKTSIMESLEYYMGTNKIRWLLPTFIEGENCNLLEQTFPIQKLQTKQYVYADEYIYGSDSDEQQLPKEA